ncbi:MAG: ATP synthase F1 subunit gamma [Bacteroidota bacterium]
MLKAKEIFNRITSIKSTQQITKALKVISATKLRQVKQKLIPLIAYNNQLKNIFYTIAPPNYQNTHSSEDWPTQPTQNARVIFFTTNRGFCGSINKQVCKKVKTLHHAYTSAKKQIQLLPIGKKAIDFLNQTNLPHNPIYKDYGHSLSLKKAKRITESLLTTPPQTQVIIIYPSNINYCTQVIKTKQLLPIAHKAIKPTNQSLRYIYEPSSQAIINEITPKLITLNLYQTLLEASEAEHAARNNAMTKATDNADSLLKELRIAYNRTRQSTITRQIIEIAASAEALKHA